MARHSKRTLATREEIKDTALQHFAARGWDGTSLEAIAAELGYTKQALYYYFPSKEDLVCSLVEDSLDRARDGMNRIAREISGPPAQLAALMALHFDEYRSGKGFFRVYHRMEGLMHHVAGSPRGRALEAKMEDMTRFIMDLVARGVESGDFVQLPPRILGGLILSMITGVLYHMDHPSLANLPPEELKELMIGLMMKGARNGDSESPYP